LAFPKYSIEYMSDAPLSSSDALKCRQEGVEQEEEFTKTRFESRKHLRGNETEDIEVEKVGHLIIVGDMLMAVGIGPDEITKSRWNVSTRVSLPHAF
jgi:hypothetical protein